MQATLRPYTRAAPPPARTSEHQWCGNLALWRERPLNLKEPATLQCKDSVNFSLTTMSRYLTCLLEGVAGATICFAVVWIQLHLPPAEAPLPLPSVFVIRNEDVSPAALRARLAKLEEERLARLEVERAREQARRQTEARAEELRRVRQAQEAAAREQARREAEARAEQDRRTREAREATLDRARREAEAKAESVRRARIDRMAQLRRTQEEQTAQEQIQRETRALAEKQRLEQDAQARERAAERSLRAREHYNVGVRNYNNDNWDSAIDEASRALDLAPSAASYYLRGLAYSQKRNDRAALADLHRAIELDSEKPAYYHQRAIVSNRMGDQDRALADETRAIDLDASKAVYWVSRGVLKYNKRAYSEALADETRAIALEPSNGRYYYLRGLTHRALGDRTAAQSDFQAALSLGYAEAERELR